MSIKTVTTKGNIQEDLKSITTVSDLAIYMLEDTLGLGVLEDNTNTLLEGVTILVEGDTQDETKKYKVTEETDVEEVLYHSPSANKVIVVHDIKLPDSLSREKVINNIYEVIKGYNVLSILITENTQHYHHLLTPQLEKYNEVLRPINESSSPIYLSISHIDISLRIEGYVVCFTLPYIWREKFNTHTK